MPLVIFVDALPHTFVDTVADDWVVGMKYSMLQPNIGYSSNLHWQLFCDIYPDEIGFFTDWAYVKETKKSVKILSHLLMPLDYIGNMGVITRKLLDRYVYRNNIFANIPFKFRPIFSENGKYLFFVSKVTEKMNNFKEYNLILQDEGNKSFDQTFSLLKESIASGQKKIFAAFGFADSLGHKLTRCDEYNKELNKYMVKLKNLMKKYVENNLNEGVLIVSDHGMSNVTQLINIPLKKHFGKQSVNSYIAYCDSAIMRVYIKNEELRDKISNYLKNLPYGHLITEEERQLYKVTNSKFGDLIFNLYDGFVFENSWFGKSLRKNKLYFGMHGFWPVAADQQGVLMTYNCAQNIDNSYSYSEAYKFITKFMLNGK